MKTLRETARVVRSKNSGPFELTLDIMFRSEAYYRQVKRGRLVTEELIARLYRIPRDRVLRVIYFDPAWAVKIVISRTVASGSPGDTDVYGAQQHGPLLELELPDPEDS